MSELTTTTNNNAPLDTPLGGKKLFVRKPPNSVFLKKLGLKPFALFKKEKELMSKPYQLKKTSDIV